MIATLSGLLSQRGADFLIVDVNGVGYKVFTSLYSGARLPALGERLFLWIHTAVREDDISLFGFVDEEEKKIFQKLIGVNGIGPKLALTILSGITPLDLVDALHREDLVRLTAISGIGKKTAERMILDLKDKFKDLLASDRIRPVAASKRTLLEEATSVLVNLGYNRSTAEQTLSQVSLEDGIPLEVVIRKALRSLEKPL